HSGTTRTTRKRPSAGTTIDVEPETSEIRSCTNRESPMSRVMRTTGVRHAVLGLALAGLAMSSIATADAGDLEGPVYGPYPRYNTVPPVFRGAGGGEHVCRIC